MLKLRNSNARHLVASIPNNTLSIADNPSIRQSALRVRAPDVYRAAAGGDGGQRPRGEAGVRLQAGLGGAAARGQDRHPRLPRQSSHLHIHQTLRYLHAMHFACYRQQIIP